MTSPLLVSISACCTKGLSTMKIHFTVISLYSAVLGMPVSLLLSIIAEATGYNNRMISDDNFIYDVIYLIVSTILSKYK